MKKGGVKAAFFITARRGSGSGPQLPQDQAQHAQRQRGYDPASSSWRPSEAVRNDQDSAPGAADQGGSCLRIRHSTRSGSGAMIQPPAAGGRQKRSEAVRTARRGASDAGRGSFLQLPGLFAYICHQMITDVCRCLQMIAYAFRRFFPRYHRRFFPPYHRSFFPLYRSFLPLITVVFFHFYRSFLPLLP